MDINKVRAIATGVQSGYAPRKSQTTTSSSTPDRSVKADAVTTSVTSDFETEQKAKVSRIAAAVSAGTYRQPDSRQLATAVVSGISEIIEAVRG